jgi:hypothetical protein
MLRISFWILFALEFLPAAFAAAAGVIGVLMGHSPKNMMLLTVPAGTIAAFLACIGAWFYFTNSKIAFGLLALPVLMIPVLFVLNLADDLSRKSEEAGNNDFKQPGMQRLANAIAANDLPAVKAAIPAAGDLKTKGERGLPVLTFALQSFHGRKPNPAIIAALLEAGADPNAATPSGSLPLEETTDFDIVQALVKHGADPNKKGRKGPVFFNAFGDMYGGVFRGDDMFDLYREHGLRKENYTAPEAVVAAARGGAWHALRVMFEDGANPKGVMIHTTPLYDHLQLSATAFRDNKDLAAVLAIVRKAN